MNSESKGKSWQANPEVIAAIKPREGINYDESKVPQFTLPNFLVNNDGKTVTTPEEWAERRREILDLLRKEEYGYSPEPPKDMWFETVSVDPNALNGDATLKLVDIHIGKGNNAPVIHLKLFVPNKRTKPVPAFLLICNRDPSNIDHTRAVKSEFWPVEEMIEKGFAISAYYYEDMAPDHFDDYQTGCYTYFKPREQRSDSDWGALAAWAWGASRCMDYFVTDPDIDHRRCAVTGHSRGGKTALWCGVQDERWAMTVSSCSGCSGAALSRRCYGESLQVITKVFPYWFCKNYYKYVNREQEIPFDQHWLIALIAPRAVYVHSADQDLWADPKGEWLSLFNAQPAWKLFGKKGLPSNGDMPALDVPVWGDGMAYHIRPGKHDNLKCDWMRHADFFLLQVK